MKVNEKVNKEEISIKTDTMTDLLVDEEQAAATKGGTREGDGSNYLLADGHVKWFKTDSPVQR